MAAIDLLSPKAASVSGASAAAGLTAISVDTVDGSIPAGGTGAAAGAWDTAPNRDTAIATVTEIKATVNSLISGLATMGLPVTGS
jgi:hypothetical protein